MWDQEGIQVDYPLPLTFCSFPPVLCRPPTQACPGRPHSGGGPEVEGHLRIMCWLPRHWRGLRKQLWHLYPRSCELSDGSVVGDVEPTGSHPVFMSPTDPEPSDATRNCVPAQLRRHGDVVVLRRRGCLRQHLRAHHQGRGPAVGRDAHISWCGSNPKTDFNASTVQTRSSLPKYSCYILPCSSHLLKSDHGMGRKGHWDPFRGDRPPRRCLHAQKSSEAEVPLWEEWQGERDADLEVWGSRATNSHLNPCVSSCVRAFPQVFFASVRSGGSSQVYFMTLNRNCIMNWWRNSCSGQCGSQQGSEKEGI